MKNYKIKVCGMSSLQQVAALVDMQVDYAGFIFYEKSPRYIKSKLSPADIKNIQGIQKVGVFVNTDPDTILQIVNDYGLQYVQLHGDESPEFCKILYTKVKIIKAFRVTGDEQLDTILQPYIKVTDYFMFDTKTTIYGGTGKKFNWQFLKNKSLQKPFFLSGGIGLEDAAAVKEFISSFNNNQEIIVDVNSRFEIAPGIKDMLHVKEFIDQLIE